MEDVSKKNFFIFSSAILGNMLEYYDFTVYAVFTIAIGQSFFPDISGFAQVICSLGVFAVGFLTRPVGGIFFGYIGDKYGRRISLIISMIGMTISTVLIGIVPGYNSIGFAAPILLVVIRLIQGLCISGEGTGAAIFVLEHYKFKQGLITGIVHSSNIMGTIIAAVSGMIIESKYGNVHEAWRIPFILGGLIGFIGLYFRFMSKETPIFQLLVTRKQTLDTPLKNVLNNSRISVLLTICTGGIASIVLYIIKTYVNICYQNVMNLSGTESLLYLLYSSFIAMSIMPIAGHINDKIGKMSMMMYSSIMIFTFSLPIFIMMTSDNPAIRIVSMTFLGVISGLISTSAYIFVISLFRAQEKFSGVGFSYNLGIAIFGGTAPIILRTIAEFTHVSYAPAFYIMLMSGLYILLIHKTRHYIAKYF